MISKIELFNKIRNEERLTAVEIIVSSEDEKLCSVVINDRMFSCPYKVIYNDELKNEIKNIVDDEILVIEFVDNELSEAWKLSYLLGGIEEERWDRRVVFHSYDDMNEMFCIDMMLLEEIKGENIHPLPEWKEYIIDSAIITYHISSSLE